MFPWYRWLTSINRVLIGIPTSPLRHLSSELAPVDELKVVAIDDASVRVSFGQVLEEANFVEGYEITYLEDGADALEKKEYRTSERSVILDNLKPGTTYNITVTPFTSQEKGGLLGSESQATVLTQLPGKSTCGENLPSKVRDR